jgi:peptidoglycan/xylan/chitin deacetylase (PgdA/CDA1 family)
VAAIQRATGAVPNLFRAPVGMANCFVRAALRDRRMSLIAWSARGFDGVPARSDKIVPRIFSTIRPRAIVLLHEGPSLERRRRDNLPALEARLSRLAQEGYACVIPDPHQLAPEHELKASSNVFAHTHVAQLD